VGVCVGGVSLCGCVCVGGGVHVCVGRIGSLPHLAIIYPTNPCRVFTNQFLGSKYPFLRRFNTNNMIYHMVGENVILCLAP